MAFTTFEEIDAWQGARVLAQKLLEPCKRAVKQHDFGWVDQVGRATASIMANIAEGNDAQSNASFIAFLGYAKRSAAEVRSHLYVGLDRGYVTKREFDECSEIVLRVTRQIAKLMQYLHKHREKGDRGMQEIDPATCNL